MSIPAETMASADRPKKRQRSFLSNLFFWGTVSIFAVIILWMSVVPLTIGAYDDRHRDRIECNVTDAKGENDNPMGRRSWSTPEVKISTSDCGSLLFVPGPGDAAYDAIAEELAEGGRFSFEMGQATRALQGAINAIGMTPEVLSYQKID